MPCPNSENCGGDVRGMCFMCIGNFDDMTIKGLRNVVKCPNTPYAMAWWIYNNHHELWDKIKDTNIKNEYKGERILKEWIGRNSFLGLEIIYKMLEDTNANADFWDYIVKMEED